MNMVLILMLSFWGLGQGNFSNGDLNNGELIVNVKRLKDNKSAVYLALYNKSQGFGKTEGMFKGAKAIPNGKSEVQIYLSGLEPGTYAIAVYQDINNNEQLDTGWLGIPKEPYGFSNNFKPSFSAPTFEKCSFIFSGKITQMIIELIH
ncbi:MAG: DUF2141 domain-containing protein [Sphingobacteriales bacterium]|nr:MAG: DUF2141 domain-containing protein [Sphingobacteriales bacterium]